MASRILSDHFYVLSPRPKRHIVSITKTAEPITPIVITKKWTKSNDRGHVIHPDLTRISEILPGQLYLSGCEVVTPANLMARKITAVVCAMTPWEAAKLNSNERVPSGIKLFRVPITDSVSSDIGAYFDSVNRFINDEVKKGGRVLVHCVAGVSRSVSLILAYLLHSGYTLLDAFNLVTEKRKIACPNDGFYRQLMRYERNLREKKYGTIVSNGYPTTIGSLPLETRTRSFSPPTFGRGLFFM